LEDFSSKEEKFEQWRYNGARHCVVNWMKEKIYV